MKKLLLSLALLPSALFANAAYATNGIYTALEGGIAALSGLPSAADANATRVRTSYAPNAARFSIGYNHDLFKRFGIGFEAGLGQYGRTTYDYANGSNTRVSARTLEFLAVGTFHVNPKFDLIAKIGGLRHTPKISGANAPKENTKIATGTAVGAIYNITPSVGVSFTYFHAFGSKVHTLRDLDGQAPSLNAAMLGVRYTFGS